MTKDQLFEQLKRVLSIEELVQQTLININQSYLRCPPRVKKELEEMLADHTREYIRTNSPLRVVLQEGIEKRDFIALSPSLHTNLEKAEYAFDSVELEQDIIPLLRQNNMIGIREELAIIEEIEQRYKDTLSQNERKQLDLTLLKARLEIARQVLMLEEQTEKSIAIQKQAEKAFEDGRIREEELTRILELEDVRQEYFDKAQDYADICVEHNIITIQIKKNYLVTQEIDPVLIQQYNESTAVLSWQSAEVNMIYAELQHKQGNITDEERGNTFAEALVTQLEIELAIDNTLEQPKRKQKGQ